MPTARDHHAIGVVYERLRAIASRINGNHDRSIGDHEECNPAADHWRARLSIPSIRSGIAVATFHGKIFVFGGEYGLRTRSEVELFDPAANKWQAWALMPAARHGLGAAILGGSI